MIWGEHRGKEMEREWDRRDEVNWQDSESF